MVGLMQVMIYLFCVYLVYKGVEIFQTAYVSTADERKRSAGIALGAFAIGMAVAIGAAAVWITESMAERIGNNLSQFK